MHSVYNGHERMSWEALMKVSFQADDLAKALAKVKPAVPRANWAALPVLYGVRFDVGASWATVTATDVDMTITADVRGQVFDGCGSFVLPATAIIQAVKGFKKAQVTFQTEGGDEVQVSCGSVSMSFRALKVEDWPKSQENFAHVSLIGAERVADLYRVAAAASGDDALPILTGVLHDVCGGFVRKVVATDSHRLAVSGRDNYGKSGDATHLLVPERIVTQVVKNLPKSDLVTVQSNGRYVQYCLNDVQIVGRLIEGEFPDYRQLIRASYPESFTVDRLYLLGACERAAKYLAKTAEPVRLEITEGTLTVTCVRQDEGSTVERFPVIGAGPAVQVAFNASYLADGLAMFTTSTVTLSTNGARKPAMITATGAPDALYLLMPVWVS